MPSNTEILLGEVIGQLKGIEGRLDRQDQSRGILHNKVNSALNRLTYIETDIDRLKMDVEGIKTITGKAKELSLRAQGAGWLGQALLGLGGWVLGTAVMLYQFWSWFAGFFRGP